MSWRITPSFTPADEYFQNVSLLLHGDGANGSTTITDNSPTPKTVTAVGNAQISTAIADPFGNSTGVIAFDGTGDWVTGPFDNAFNFGLGDYTVEMWAYFNQSKENGLWGNGNAASGALSMYVLADNKLHLSRYGDSPDIISINSIQLLTWTHLAVTCNAGTTRIFINGVLEGSRLTAFNNSKNGLIVGRPFIDAAQPLNGYIDELRITKGIARYTANFTPPTAPFPDI